MLKDFNKSGRNLKGDDYEGYDDFNNSSEQGVYVWLRFDNEEFEVSCYINNNHILEQIILINEEAQQQGDSFGEVLYINNEIKNIPFQEIVNKSIIVLKQEQCILN